MHKIAVIPGDGTGPEVTREALKVLGAAASSLRLQVRDHRLRLRRRALSAHRRGAARNGGERPAAKFDAIFLGAIGHPDVKPGILEKGILLRLRFELDQYINLRPVKLYPGVETPAQGQGARGHRLRRRAREHRGLYAGAGGMLKKGTPDEVAIQESINTRKGVERCLRYAFEYARKRNRARRSRCAARPTC